MGVDEGEEAVGGEGVEGEEGEERVGMSREVAMARWAVGCMVVGTGCVGWRRGEGEENRVGGWISSKGDVLSHLPMVTTRS